MRHKFISALNDLCLRRSSESPAIKWWFSEVKSPPRRVGASEWSEEATMPFGADPITPTIEDPPLGAEFWQPLNYG